MTNKKQQQQQQMRTYQPGHIPGFILLPTGQYVKAEDLNGRNSSVGSNKSTKGSMGRQPFQPMVVPPQHVTPPMQQQQQQPSPFMQVHTQAGQTRVPGAETWLCKSCGTVNQVTRKNLCATCKGSRKFHEAVPLPIPSQSLVQQPAPSGNKVRDTFNALLQAAPSLGIPTVSPQGVALPAGQAPWTAGQELGDKWPSQVPSPFVASPAPPLDKSSSQGLQTPPVTTGFGSPFVGASSPPLGKTATTEPHVSPFSDATQHPPSNAVSPDGSTPTWTHGVCTPASQYSPPGVMADAAAVEQKPMSGEAAIKAHRSKIAKLEAMIAFVEADEVGAPALVVLQAQLDEARILLRKSQPCGKRLDEAKEKLERSRKRHKELQEYALQVHNTLGEAQQEVDALEHEVLELQAELAVEKPEPGPAEQPSDVALSSLQPALEALLSKLITDPYVDPQHKEQATASVNGMVQGFVAAQAHADAEREKAQAQRRRHREKTRQPSPPRGGLPEHMQEPSRIRCNGKQSVPMKACDIFRPGRSRSREGMGSAFTRRRTSSL